MHFKVVIPFFGMETKRMEVWKIYLGIQIKKPFQNFFRKKRAKLTWRNWRTSCWIGITSSSCWAGTSGPMWNHLTIGTAGTGTLTWIPALFLFTSSVTWAVWIDQTFWSTVWWYTNVSNFTSTSCRITISYSTIWVTTARGWSAWINCLFNHRLDWN